MSWNAETPTITATLTTLSLAVLALMFISIGVPATTLVTRCMNGVRCVIGLLTDALMRREKIYPRDCFACGEPMKQEPNSTTLVCTECQISENGTIKGRYHYPFPKHEWNDELIEPLDHGALYYPTPDSMGYRHELVSLVESPQLRTADGEAGQGAS
jgi:hypothetical protein